MSKIKMQTDSTDQTVSTELLTANYQLPTANYQLPTANYQLQTVDAAR